jgi:predicted PurR-regulated permease PerM
VAATGAPPALPIWLTVVLGLAGAFVGLWGLHNARFLLAPVLLAFVLTVVAHPLLGALTRRGVPRGVAVALLVLAVDGGLIAFTLAVIVSVGQLATVLPQYSDEWQHLLDGLRSTLSGLGIGQEQVRQIVSGIGPGPVLAALGGVLKATAGVLAALVLVLTTALFMAVDAAGLPERLVAVPRVSPGLRDALHEFARSTRRYMVITSVFGFAVAVVDTVALYLLGVPLALLWGLLSFLTNYVPNIGFVLGLLPPTLLALLVGGPGLAVAVVVVYCVANFVIQSVVQPVFVGDAVGLSVTLTFLSTIAWTVVLGPLGAILAIPLTLLAYAVLVGQDPDRRWARVLLAGASGSSAGDDADRPNRRHAVARARFTGSSVTLARPGTDPEMRR